MKKEFLRQCQLNKTNEQFRADLDLIYEIELNEHYDVKIDDRDIDAVIKDFSSFNDELSSNMFVINSKDYFTED